MSQGHTLKDVKSKVDRLARQIAAPRHLLPSYGSSQDGARPHIEVDARGYHYVVVERGKELSRITTTEMDELLYHVFKAVTFTMACNYELKHRMQDRDVRRLIFTHQVELLSQLSSKWGDREAQEHERILRKHPYTDNQSSHSLT
jgi:hypothetical protein